VQRAEVRRSILAATEELLVDEGFEGFSMRRLADRCGYTTPTIYHHFGDKAGLIDELLEERFAQMIDRIDQVPELDDHVERLRAQLAAFVEFGLENPTHYSLLMAPRPRDMPPPPESVDRSRARIGSTLEQLAQQGRLQLADIDEAIQCIWVMLHGLISTRISRPDHDWTENQIEASIGILLRGMLREPDTALPAPPRGGGR
jgi:AcrR family transcriptional regulator